MHRRLTGVLSFDLADVILMKRSSEKKLKLGIIHLFLLGHLLKLWSVSSHELGQLHDDVAELWNTPRIVIIIIWVMFASCYWNLHASSWMWVWYLQRVPDGRCCFLWHVCHSVNFWLFYGAHVNCSARDDYQLAFINELLEALFEIKNHGSNFVHFRWEDKQRGKLFEA